MSTINQIRANQANAQNSTGPSTPEGKAKVSQNRRTHGLTGGHVILPTESTDDYAALLDRLLEDHNPQTETERFLVAQTAELEWKLVRAAQWEQKEILEGEPLSEKFNKIARYQNQIRRAHLAILRELRLQQQARAKREEAERKRRREDLSAQLDEAAMGVYTAETELDDSNPISAKHLLGKLLAGIPSKLLLTEDLEA